MNCGWSLRVSIIDKVVTTHLGSLEGKKREILASTLQAAFSPPFLAPSFLTELFTLTHVLLVPFVIFFVPNVVISVPKYFFISSRNQLLIFSRFRFFYPVAFLLSEHRVGGDAATK